MDDITITVRDKIASTDTEEIICGNSDYTIVFALDAEWDEHDLKTMRIAWTDTFSGQPRHTDFLFSGDSVALPVVPDAYEIAIGVYASNLITSTPARIPCRRCITDGGTYHGDPEPDIYEQLLEAIGQIDPPGPSTEIIVPGTTRAAYNSRFYLHTGITVPVGDGDGEAHYTD